MVTDLPARQSIAARLALLADPTRDEPSLFVSQQALAELTGLTRKTVTDYLAELEAEGLIRRSYRTIRVIDRPGLQGVVES